MHRLGASADPDYELFLFKVNVFIGRIDARMKASDLVEYVKTSTKKSGVSLRVKSRSTIRRIAQLINS